MLLPNRCDPTSIAQLARLGNKKRSETRAADESQQASPTPFDVRRCSDQIDRRSNRLLWWPIKKDIAQAKKLYSKLLGVEPYTDEAYYVGFRVGDQEIGLDPHGHNQGITGPIVYFHVSDIQNSLQSLLDAGAQTQQEVKDVGVVLASQHDGWAIARRSMSGELRTCARMRIMDGNATEAKEVTAAQKEQVG